MKLRPWHVAFLIVAICVCAVAAALWASLRSEENDRDLFTRFPSEDAVYFYLDAQQLRRAGLMDAIAGAGSSEEFDYKLFVDATGFDYRRDLDSIAAAFLPDASYFLVRGAFDWDQVFEYVSLSEGRCLNLFCQMPATKAGRRVSLFPARSTLLGVAVSQSPTAAHNLQEQHATPAGFEFASAPVWVSARAKTLQNLDLFPEGARAFLGALSGADRVTLSLAPHGTSLSAVLDLACETEANCAAVTARLRETTDTLRKLIARENKEPNPRDLSGVLVNGEFTQTGAKVRGSWPIPSAFIQNLLTQER